VPGAITFGPLATPSGATLAPATADVPTNLSATIAQTFTWPASLNSPEVTSHPITVIPQAAGNLTLTIPQDAITLGVTTQIAISVTFNVAIRGGENYTLQIKMRKGLRWAGSNVYWDPTLNNNQGSLTFVPHGDRTKEMYQGVFFKWGSLMGMDPSEYNGNIVWNSSNNILYVPTYNSTTPASSTWAATTGKDWDDIPYVTPTSGSASTDKLEAESNAANYALWKGDICRYLSESDEGGTGVVSGRYRMATGNELRYGDKSSSSATIEYDETNWQNATTIVGYWTWIAGSGSTSSTDATGQFILSGGGNYSGYAVFPASGDRSQLYGPGNLQSVGISGYCWSSSTNSIGDEAYVLCLYYDYISMSAVSPMYGCPVRCLLDE
jgi:hypothetical protein